MSHAGYGTLEGRRWVRVVRSGFTLLEIVLAIALSAVLLGLLTLAVDQYLVNVQSSRASVEHAQVARGVLRMIADDLRNTATAYEQDISAAETLAEAAASKNFDADSVDEPVDSFDEGSGSEEQSIPLGVTGDQMTLQVDVLRTRRPAIEQPEEFAVAPDETLFIGPPATSGISSVRYSIGPQGGLVRQEVARDVMQWEEKQGVTTSWDATYQVVAEEVVQIEFRYLAGLEALSAWDLVEREGENPTAVEVRVMIREPVSRRSQDSDEQPPTRAYRMTVALPGVDGGAASDDSETADDASI